MVGGCPIDLQIAVRRLGEWSSPPLGGAQSPPWGAEREGGYMRRGFTLLTVVAVLFALAAVPAVAQPEGATMLPIAGELDLTGGTPGDLRITPGGIFHEQGGTAVTEFTGDVAGTVTFFYKRVHFTADFSYMVAKGPYEGEVTWNGRTGSMAGMFTTNCRPDSAGLLSCGGTMIGHGSGDLDGVKFHIDWGPGWWPFSYDGFALDPHGG